MWTFVDSATVKEIVNTALDWFGFAVWSSNPSGLLDVVSITNFVAWKISCSVFETSISFRFAIPTFESFVGLFSPVCQPFFEQVGKLGVKLRHIVHEIDWSVLFLLMLQIWYLRKWRITSISQNLHMRVTRFKSLWVSVLVRFMHYTCVLLLYVIVILWDWVLVSVYDISSSS